MGKRTEYAPGTFSYVELSASDADAAKSFYGEIFGWDYEDTELPEDAGGGTYTTCNVEGEVAAAIFRGDGSLPPHWNNYVTVESAEGAKAKAEELGGKVMMGPIDVMGFGYMVAIADPTGGAFMAWEPKQSIGARRVNEHGCFTWNELHTPDVDAALEFYTGMFGWNTEEMQAEGGPRYVVIKVGERTNGGVMGAQEGEPPNWMPYFGVESREDAVGKVGDGGGNVLAQMEFGTGLVAVMTDPQGAMFGIFEGDFDD